MRKIEKADTPACLQEFIDGQLAIAPEPVNLTYDDFRDKAALLAVLTAEQYGLCGYTGAPVDERISGLVSPSGGAAFRNHIEHLKCQEACRRELVDNGGEYGRVLADDLSYQNMIAALEIRGAAREHFGAVRKSNLPLPVLPTDEGCDELFGFREADGVVEGLSNDANESIRVLNLNHNTLSGWRMSAIEVWLDPDVIRTREDVERVAQEVRQPIDGKLPEYSFAIGDIAGGLLR